ncbi:outer membrane lipoprotein carrier protein LolA [Vibrio fluvialis]|nr:outer membrane lipoprotein carrier protein LolA [Vibrio fluvialis]MCE7585734.1 outer membrane lipoprotein carrier protein LolA [Vibrio fluvialis]
MMAKKTYRLLTLLALSAASLFSTAIAQVTDLASLQTQLQRFEIVRGDFTQSRKIEMFASPLSSQGTFLLDKAHGLLWQQSTPFPVNLVLTQDKLRQTFTGQAPQTITAKENPMAFYFSHIFLSVFHGDTEQLQSEFDLDFSVQDEQWTLVLTPKGAPLNAVFKHITLQGQDDINALSLQEVRGDNTEIRFSAQTHEPQTLSQAEQAQFEF